MLRSIVSSLLLAMPFCGLAAAQHTKPITEAETVFAIYTNDWGRRASSGPQLIVSVWGDGTVVWSSDHLNGGPPYLTAQVDPKDVSATLDRLVDIGVFELPQLKQARFGPDSKFTTLLVRTGGKELKMDSWHEPYESSGKVVAADRGLTGLDGKKLLLALAEQPADVTPVTGVRGAVEPAVDDEPGEHRGILPRQPSLVRCRTRRTRASLARPSRRPGPRGCRPLRAIPACSAA
jgi:hypothetical protein